MKKYKIIKLKSGEDIIGTVRISKDETVKVYHPMVFKSMVQTDLFGGVKELFMLKDWLMLSDNKLATIKKDAINTIVDASADAAGLYEMEKEKNKHKPTKTKAKKIQEPLNGETGPHAGLDPFDIIDKHSKELLDKNDKMYEEESNLKDFAKRKSDDKMIFMNMVFSPNVLIELLKTGILDRKEFGEMINEITNNGEGMHPEKYTGNKKDKKDFGNIWTDWNPDPSSEDYK